MSGHLIKKLKENGQDFEWYPTTREMLKIIADDIDISTDRYQTSSKILDIGAGNGSALNIITEILDEKIHFKKYAIEKSKILCEQMPDDIFIVGTDFHAQTLVDKKVNVVFCNPPYSEYVDWMIKIIKEAYCQAIYFVVPGRWSDNKEISDAISARDGKIKILRTMDFKNSEFRQSRAKIDIVKITIGGMRYRSGCYKDPFKLWFDESFKFDIAKDEFCGDGDKKGINHDATALINKSDLIESSVRLYQKDLDHLLKNYRSLESIDPDLLEELEVNLASLCEALKMKITGLKTVHWKELFSSLRSITDSLTSKSRGLLLDTMMDNMNVDFTQNNIYTIVIWVLKNANKYFDKQLTEVYKTITSKDAIKLYKSNTRIITDDFRFSRNKISNYKLDYRIIHDGFRVLVDYSPRYEHGLSKTATDFLKDIFAVAGNLGYRVIEKPEDFKWESRKLITFHYMEDGKEEIFATVRAYLKGTLHFKFNQKFMRAWNIEAARILGWIKDPEHASREMDENVNDIKQFFGKNLRIGIKDVPMLCEKT